MLLISLPVAAEEADTSRKLDGSQGAVAAGTDGLQDLLPSELQRPGSLRRAPAFAPNGDRRDLRWMLVSQNAQRAVWQGLLGERRARELEKARFELHLNDLHHDREMREDEDGFRDLCETVGRSVGKVLRERVERRLDFDGALGRRRSSGSGQPSLGWRLSPRIDVGSSNRLGMKFMFRDGARSWVSRTSLQLSHDFDEDLYMKLVYNGQRAEAEMRFIGDDQDFGQTVTFDVRFGLGSLRRAR